MSDAARSVMLDYIEATGVRLGRWMETHAEQPYSFETVVAGGKLSTAVGYFRSAMEQGGTINLDREEPPDAAEAIKAKEPIERIMVALWMQAAHVLTRAMELRDLFELHPDNPDGDKVRALFEPDGDFENLAIAAYVVCGILNGIMDGPNSAPWAKRAATLASAVFNAEPAEGRAA